MTVKLLTEHHLEFLSLKGGCGGSSESTHVKMPHCWKSHVTVEIEVGRVATGRPGSLCFSIIWASTQETVALLLADNEGTDQPAHPHSLSSAFAIRYIKSKVTRSDIS